MVKGISFFFHFLDHFMPFSVTGRMLETISAANGEGRVDPRMFIAGPYVINCGFGTLLRGALALL